MNILFLTLSHITTIQERGLYQDLLREIIRIGHSVYVVSPMERRNGEKTRIVEKNKCKILRVKTGNIQKINLIEKGISTLLIEYQLISAIKKYFSDITFNLVVYSTPPITFGKTVKYIKKKHKAKSYLLLKDIFPQNAVDLGMFSKNGVIHKYFRAKERKLYELSDFIGCMSQANVDYVIKHNPYIEPGKVEICANSVEPWPPVTEGKLAFRKKHNIHEDAVIFLYGGNLGKPQDIDFVIRCMEQNMNRTDRFFVICGDGTEHYKLKKFMDVREPGNILLSPGLPKAEYDGLKACCDVGLIFLDRRFTIPNFPSRLLSYMENAMPVLACTDRVSDVGQVIMEGNFGWWCESADAGEFTSLIERIVSLKDRLSQFGQAGREYLEEHYTASQSAGVILRHFDIAKEEIHYGA